MFLFFMRMFEITSVSFCAPPSAPKEWAGGVVLCTRVSIFILYYVSVSILQFTFGCQNVFLNKPLIIIIIGAQSRSYSCA